MPSPTRPRPVVHACAAFGAGMLIALGAPWLGILAWVPVGLVLAVVLPVAGAGLAFGLIGAGFHGRRGWWLAFTAIPWSAAMIIFWTLGLTTGSWGFTLAQSIAAGTVAAGCALLSWRAPARVIGAALVLLVAAAAGAWSVSLAVTGSAPGGDRSGDASVFTTSVPGYAAESPAETAGASSVVYRGGENAFLLSTEPFDVDACGADLRAPDGVAEAETGCTSSAERWYRTSATLHEVAVVRDGRVVRASAAQTVPLGDLEIAIAMAIPDGAEWISDAPS